MVLEKNVPQMELHFYYDFGDICDIVIRSFAITVSDECKVILRLHLKEIIFYHFTILQTKSMEDGVSIPMQIIETTVSLIFRKQGRPLNTCI